jgi:peptidoglycan/LPS O-acetylase OafA/YrhL/glycosyltransferase involved in cell wall biosynthesis/O-antigen/teichoic acid export membrane protein
VVALEQAPPTPSVPKAGGPRPEIRAFTGIRGMAAVWVLLCHVVPMAAQSIPGLRWMQRLTVTGELGVDLFFILSGFVLSYAYTVRDAFGPGRSLSSRLRYYAHFLTVRLARIYPVYITVTLALAVVALGSHVVGIDLKQTGTFGWDFTRNVVLVQGWDLSSHLSWDGPAWSVSCEWAAYLAFPFLLLLTSRVRRAPVAILGIACSLGVELTVFGFVGAGQPQLTYFHPLVRIAGEFIAGCFLYRLYECRLPALRWLAKRHVGPLVFLLALFGAALLSAAGQSTIWAVALFPLVLTGTWRDDTSWSRILASPRMVRLGEMSYAIYLIHYPALMLLQKIWVIPSSPLLRLAVIVVGCGAVVVVSGLMYDRLEVPARRRMRSVSLALLPDRDPRVNERVVPTRPSRQRRSEKVSGRIRRDSVLVLLGNVATGISNYGFTLVLLWILPARQFSQVASIAALLLVAGTVAQAGVPWVLARELVRRSPGDPGRAQAVGFALTVAVALGAVTSAVVVLLSARYASPGVEAAAVVAVMAVFVAQVGSGYLQGSYRFRFFAFLMTAEAVVRLLVGAILATAGAGSGGAVAGFAAGAVLAAGIALWIVRHEIAFPRVSPGIWRQLGGLGGIQVGVAILATLDVIVESVVNGTSRAFAGYQAVLVFTRIPLFISAALSAVVYPHLVRKDADENRIVAESTAAFLLMSTLIVAVVSDAPPTLMAMVFPARYAHSMGVLLPLAIAGLACGQVNYSTTLLQAKSAFRTALGVLGTGLPLAALLLTLESNSLTHLAWAAAGVDATLAVTLVATSSLRFAIGAVRRPSLVGGIGLASVLVIRSLVHDHGAALALDAVVIATTGAAMVRLVRRVSSSMTIGGGRAIGAAPSGLTLPATTTPTIAGEQQVTGPIHREKGTAMEEPRQHHIPTPGRSLRILHLAFEDHRQPGSGGGSLRTREINTRLAGRHEITSVVARYKGARTRVEDGVTYRPLGFSWGRVGSIVTYHLALPWFVFRHRADLIVEDFAAPHSSDVVPLWTDSPTVAVVQYLFAEEKSRQYHLPLWALEETGVKMHRHFVAVSQHIADRLKAVNDRASIEVIYAGVEAPDDDGKDRDRNDVLFLGRLEFEQKGLDLLVDAFAEIKRQWPGVRLRIAGNGPGEERLRRLLSHRGLAPEVDWLGRVEGEAKWRELRTAALVLMPSRFETFGLVALEAMAVGTPVVSFALPALLEINGKNSGLLLVPPGEGVELGRAAAVLLGDGERRAHMAAAAKGRAAEFDWDQAALAHERAYLAASTDCRDRSRGARMRQLLAARPRRPRPAPAPPASPRVLVTHDASAGGASL